jgi:hypothetical protein
MSHVTRNPSTSMRRMFPAAAAASCCCGGFRVNLDALYKMDFSNIGNEDVNQIHLAQDRVKLQTFMIKIIQFRIT